jgi:hypothetical protein
MKRPPFKIDGRNGAIRSTRTDTGRPWIQTGRVGYCWDTYAQAVLAGVAEPTAEARLNGKPWHLVALSADEARDLLLTRMGGKRTVANCERIAAARAAKTAAQATLPPAPAPRS